ncbi:toxic anion resistance protein [Aquisalimonas lutea]|uniref:toxic anion resistance protein n=1 Tax=Aquisalimonas lutea TaxID=1327750 RepID=UPI0025B430B5|nr:toxic anion resistance protein [Aquisalimonas lutea]MDN3518009.1 toxic anion resistance protein [Aquisalimonas lutea]
MSQQQGDAAGGEPLRLELPGAEDVAGGAAPDTDPGLEAEARASVDRLVEDARADGRSARETVDRLGLEEQQEAAHRSAMLQTPLRRLAHQGDDGGPVAESLEALRGRMEELDPNRHNLSRDGMSRLLARIPGVGSRLQRYFRRFETAQEALDGIIRDLESGRDMLRRDNITLSDDQAALQESLQRLRRQVALGRLMDERLAAAASSHAEDDPQRTFLENELLFPLRQRITDLQQQQVVAQQGILALEVVIRNNRELMRGVDRALNVTVSALNVAVTVALGLANQRLVLDRVEALNASTSNMIAGTAQKLRDQGVAIQQRAASTSLDMEQLEEAFANVMAAIDEVARYRRDALPRLDAQIDRLEQLARQGDAALRDMPPEG